MEELNMIICGVGGQGNLLVERIIGVSAMQEGYSVWSADPFGAAQRGGSVLSHVRVGVQLYSSLVPQGKCDVLMDLEPGEALNQSLRFLGRQGLAIVNTCPFFPVKVKVGERAYPPVEKILKVLREITPHVIDLDATALARKTAGSERSMNVVMTGVLMGAGVLELKPETVKETVQELTGRFAEGNLRAFEAGFEIGNARPERPA
jgi:indolepyruvate ferredoxin oxidoreductase beta subunit